MLNSSVWLQVTGCAGGNSAVAAIATNSRFSFRRTKNFIIGELTLRRLKLHMHRTRYYVPFIAMTSVCDTYMSVPYQTDLMLRVKYDD